MKKNKIEIQHKIGLVFYIAFIVGVFAFIGCKHIEKTNEKKQIEKEIEKAAKEILNHPNLNKLESHTNKKTNRIK